MRKVLENIQGTNIEIADSYTYMDAYLKTILYKRDNTDALYRKGQSKHKVVRRIRSF